MKSCTYMKVDKTQFWIKYSWGLLLLLSILGYGNSPLVFNENEELVIVACPELEIDISTACLQHCADNQYFVNYCNIGGMPVEGATIEITLDAFLSPVSTSIPIVTQTDNVLTFEVGDLNPGDCGTFQLTAFLDCDAVVGQAHCVEAQIFPDSLCVTPDADWDESLLEIDFNCNGDSIFFEILNTGEGDMDNPSQFYIIIDDVMVLLDGFQLESGQSTTIGTPTTGGTFHFEVIQSSGYPENSFAGITVENCQVGDNFTTGFFPQFPQNGNNPSTQISCQQSVDTCLFNNKTAIPRGLGNDHRINANQPIEYQINFQNTTNVTLSELVICDTLSPFLNPATVATGASSHPYTVEVVNGNVLKFTFDNINLSDSMSNFVESYGFIEFTIDQQSDNPPGTVIENEALLIFDEVDSLMTNEVFHTIAEPMVTTNLVKACGEYDYFGTIITDDTVFQDTVDFGLFRSILITIIEISEPMDIFLAEFICPGDVYEYEGNIFFDPGIYFFEIENPNGCTDQVTLELFTENVEEIFLDAEICEGESFEYNNQIYTETGIYQNFDFSPQGCLVPIFIDLTVYSIDEEYIFNQICQGQSYNYEGVDYIETTLIETTYTNQFGCDSLVVFELNVTLPEINFYAETTCEDEPITIESFTFSETGFYQETFINNFGCEEIFELDLTVFEKPETFLNDTICEGETFTLGNETFSETGDYSIILTSENGCDSIIFLNLFIETKEITCEASVGNDTLICGLQTLLSGTPAGGEWSAIGDTIPGNTTFVWVNNTLTEVAVLECGEYLFAYTATSFFSSMIFDPMLMDSVLVVDTCVAIDTVMIEFLDATIEVNSKAACEEDNNGNAQILGDFNMNNQPTFSINNQDFQEALLFENLTANSYQLYYQIDGECLDSLAFIVEEIPILPEISLDNEYHFCGEGDGVNLEIDLNYDVDLVDFLWSNGATTPNTFFNENGKEFVEISTACEAQKFDFTIIDDFQNQELYMPNAFSPNQDGTNDIFGPIYNLNPNLLELSIYSRWGQQVFHTTDFNNLWDGTFNGKKLDEDVYIWVLQAQIPNCRGEVKTFDLKGDVTLIR